MRGWNPYLEMSLMLPLTGKSKSESWNLQFKALSVLPLDVPIKFNGGHCETCKSTDPTSISSQDQDKTGCQDKLLSIETISLTSIASPRVQHKWLL